MVYGKNVWIAGLQIMLNIWSIKEDIALFSLLFTVMRGSTLQLHHVSTVSRGMCAIGARLSARWLSLEGGAEMVMVAVVVAVVVVLCPHFVWFSASGDTPAERAVSNRDHNVSSTLATSVKAVFADHLLSVLTLYIIDLYSADHHMTHVYSHDVIVLITLASIKTKQIQHLI